MLRKKDDVVSAAPMSKIIDMSWTNLRDNWIKKMPDFPLLEKGQEGKFYKFEVVKVLKFMISVCNKRIAENEKRNQRTAEMAGVDVPDADKGMDIAELRQQAALTLDVHAAKERQGYFIPAQTVVDFVARYNSDVVNAILGVKQQLDPTGNLEPDVREQVDEYLRSVAVDVKKKAEQFIGEFGAHISKGGT